MRAITDVNLQAIASVFSSEQSVFDLSAWGIFGVLFFVWLAVGGREQHPTQEHVYFNIAALAILTLLPIYRRSYDTRLLLVTVPTIGFMLSRSRILGSFATILTPLATLPFFQYQYRAELFLRHSPGAWQAISQHRLLFVLIARMKSSLFCFSRLCI